MEAKLKLAFKNLFEKKLSKEKYMNNQIGAAQKALAKVKEMREARMFNISLYKYKGDIKGIKVIAKNPKTPNISKQEEIPIEKEEEKNEVKEEIPVEKEEEKNEMLLKKWTDELMKRIEEKTQTKETIQKEEKDNNDEETKAEWAREQHIMEQKANKKWVDDLMKKIEEEEEEEIEEIEEPEKIQTKSIPQKRPIKEPKLPKQVRPIPPRKPKVIQQKYLTPKPQSEPEISKPKRDYKNNKSDRIKAIHKMIFGE